MMKSALYRTTDLIDYTKEFADDLGVESGYLRSWNLLKSSSDRPNPVRVSSFIPVAYDVGARHFCCTIFTLAFVTEYRELLLWQ